MLAWPPARSSKSTIRSAMLLGAFVALAGDHDDVAAPGGLEGGARWPIDGRGQSRLGHGSRLDHPAEDVIDDGDRVLAAGVVRCHDDPIGEFGSDPRPSRAACARSRSPPHPNTTMTECPVGDGASRCEHLAETVGRVRVVDDDAEARGGRRAGVDRLEPTGDRLRPIASAADGDGRVDAELDRGRRGRIERVRSR